MASGVINIRNNAVPSITLSGYHSLSDAWDTLNIYDEPVIVKYNNYGYRMALMYKYSGGQYGMAMSMHYATTDIETLSMDNGVKTVKTVRSQ